MLIGIGGASNTGKSWLAQKIKDNLNDKDVIILCQDKFVYPENNIPLIRDHINWETPESIDFQRLKNEIELCIPVYKVVIVEGLLAFHDDNINQLFDKRIFIEISKELFFNRKTEDQRWGKEPEWYIRYIWESYLQYGGIHSKEDSYLILSAKNIDIKKALDYIC